MFGSGATEVDYGTKSPPVALEKCLGIEPQPGKNCRSEKAIGVCLFSNECTLLLFEPKDLVGFQSADDVLNQPACS
jgi:hypothetical protein